MTKEEFDDVSMERMAWWKCIIQVWLCIADAINEPHEKAKKEAAEREAAAAKELQTYLDQCECEYQTVQSTDGFCIFDTVQTTASIEMMMLESEWRDFTPNDFAFAQAISNQ